MPSLSSPVSTPAGMPAINQAHVGKYAGTFLHFPTFAAFSAAITSGATGYAADLWADGQQMSIADEAVTGAVRMWQTSLSHARTVRVGGATVVLAADTNRVLANVGAPLSGTGTTGDVAVDLAAGAYYLKTAGGWSSSLPLYPGLGASSSVGPISISAPDGFDVGDVLTATPTTGWTVSGYQWTRDGVDIAGATSSTYALAYADAGKTVGCRAVGAAYSALAVIPPAGYLPGQVFLNGQALYLNGAAVLLN